MKPPERLRRARVESYLAERTRRKRVSDFLTKVMEGLVQGAIDSGREAHIRRALMTEDGVLSLTRSDWEFAERTGLVNLHRVNG